MGPDRETFEFVFKFYKRQQKQELRQIRVTQSETSSFMIWILHLHRNITDNIARNVNKAYLFGYMFPISDMSQDFT